MHFTRDEKEKEEMLKKLKEETIPKFLDQLEKQLIKRGGEHFAGSAATWAELDFLQFVDLINKIKEDFLADFPKLKHLDDKTRKIPNVAKWLKDRPNNDY